MKQRISVLSLIIMTPKHVLVPDCAHSFIIEVQLSFPTVAVSIPVKHVDHIVPTARGLTTVVEHPHRACSVSAPQMLSQLVMDSEFINILSNGRHLHAMASRAARTLPLSMYNSSFQCPASQAAKHSPLWKLLFTCGISSGRARRIQLSHEIQVESPSQCAR